MADAPKVKPTEQVREMQALLRITGNYKGPVNGVGDQATQDSINKFLTERQIDLSKTPKDKIADAALSQMRTEVTTSPRTLDTLKAMKAEGSADSIATVQYGLRAYGAPLEVTGKLNTPTTSALDRLVSVQEAEARREAAAAPQRPAASTPARPKYVYDAEVEEAQKLLVAHGIGEVTLKEGQKPKQMLIDGLNGPITNKGMAEYKAKNNLGNDVSFADTLKHMRENVPKPQAAINLTTASAQVETDAARRDRLGLSGEQFAKLKEDEQKWQAAARADGATGDSPYVRADKQDRMVQQRLGMDDQKWAALKRENQEWQNKQEAAIASGQPYSKEMGPMAKAVMAMQERAQPFERRTGDNDLRTAPYRPLPMFPEKDEGPVTAEDIRRAGEELRRQRTMPIDPGQSDLQQRLGMNDRQFDRLQDAQARWEAQRASGSPHRMQSPVEQAVIRADMQDARRQGLAYAGTPIDDRIARGTTPGRERPVYGREDYRRPGADFDRASGTDSSNIRERLDNRRVALADLQREGYDPVSARAIWKEERTAELRNQGLSDRQAAQMIGQEERLGNLQDRGGAARDRAYGVTDAQIARQEAADRRRAEAAARREYAEDRKAGGTWAGIAADLLGVKGAGRRAIVSGGQAIGGMTSDGNMGDTRTGQTISRDFGSAGSAVARNAGATGPVANAIGGLTQAGSRVFTYSQQDGGNAGPAAARWDDRKISGEYANAGLRGATPEERQALLQTNEAIARAQVTAEAAPTRVRYQQDPALAGGP